MSLQILSLKLDGITAGDYLTWCRDPEPPALDHALGSIRVNADPLGDTITAILDWNQPAPPPAAAATAAGLPLSQGVQTTRRRSPACPTYVAVRGSRGSLTASTRNSSSQRSWGDEHLLTAEP